MSADEFVVRRVGRDARALVTAMEPDEPRTTHSIADLLTYPERRLRRAWTIERADGALAAATVLVRVAFDRWNATVYVRDAAAAAHVARLVDRSPAATVMGAAADITPLLPHLTRVRGVLVAPWAIVRHPVDGVLGPPDDRTRAATILDLEPLVDLYSGYEGAQVRTRWQLRAYLRRMLQRHLMAVYELEGGEIAGAIALEGRSRQFVIGSDLTVAVEHRREGIAWELAKRGLAMAGAMRLGAAAVIAPSNPMRRDDPQITWDDEHYYSVTLGDRRRFKGQTRLRRLYRRWQPVTPRRPFNFRDPANPDVAAPAG